MKKTKILVSVLSLFCLLPAKAQQPLISIFKENYFVTGVPLNTRPAYDTNDLTFQISMRFNVFQPLCRNGWDVFAGYSQLSVWDVYRPSNPFRSNIYCYGMYAGHGPLFFGFEHRSNGYGSKDSRALNYLFATLTGDFGRWFSGQATGRFGVGGMGNDIGLEMFDRYQGYLNFALSFHTPDRRFQMTASASPLFMGAIPANLMAEIAYRPTRSVDWLYLTVRYHYGYDENQLDCGTPGVFLRHMLRFGLSIQPGNMAHKLFF